MQPNGDRADDRARTKRRHTVAEAARGLGLSAEAVRSRLKRGTLAGVKENGTVYVLLDADKTSDRVRPNGGGTFDRTSDQTLLVESLREQVEYLKSVLATRDEEIRRRDHIIAGLVERVPALESPPGPRDGSEPPVSEAGAVVDPLSDAEDARSGSEPRSWWRWFFRTGR
jgi:DNA-binding Lrp family transcriptional regulator